MRELREIVKMRKCRNIVAGVLMILAVNQFNLIKEGSMDIKFTTPEIVLNVSHTKASFSFPGKALSFAAV